MSSFHRNTQPNNIISAEIEGLNVRTISFNALMSFWDILEECLSQFQKPSVEKGTFNLYSILPLGKIISKYK